jgi:hypothetical protein
MQTPDLRLIRLVAARYQRMQGLRTMADAFWPLWFAALLHFVSDWWDAALFFAVMIAYMWSRSTWLPRRIEAYYAERFGRAGADRWGREDLGFWFSMAISFHETLRDMFRAPDYVRIGLILPVLCAYPLWIVVRDAPFRLYWLAVFLVGFTATIRIPWVPIGEGRHLWERDSYLAIGLALLAAGALDHLLVAYTLRGGTRAGTVLEKASGLDSGSSA